MALNRNYTQEENGIRHEQELDGIRLLTPTKPQWIRDDLEKDLLLQVAFSPRVWDAITHPIILTGGRTFVPTLLFDLFSGLEGRPVRYAVVIDRPSAPACEETVAAGRAWAAARGADVAFRIVDATMIATPHLGNARLLTPYVGNWPHEDYLAVICKALAAAPDGTLSVATALDRLIDVGLERPFASSAVRQAVANGFLGCDLSLAYGPGTILHGLPPGYFQDSDRDPILSLIQAASDGADRAS